MLGQSRCAPSPALAGEGRGGGPAANTDASGENSPTQIASSMQSDLPRKRERWSALRPHDFNSQLQKRADLCPREGRPRLYRLPPVGHAGMFPCRHLVRRDFLVDPLDEGHGCDIGDRIALADQPAGRLSASSMRSSSNCYQLGPRVVALFLGVGLARDAQPGLLPLLARDVLQFLGELLRPTIATQSSADGAAS